MSKPYVIEFRNGGYLVNLDAKNSGPLRQAMRFATRDEAKRLMAENEWVLFHGGCVIDASEVKP